MNDGIITQFTNQLISNIEAMHEFLFGKPKHANCRSITMAVDPIFFDGKPRYMDIKPPETYEDYQIRKWLSQVPHGGIVGNMAVLICYNEKHPSASLVIVEDIKTI
jgi:hypothetical protein